jgi:hypothetical protein
MEELLRKLILEQLNEKELDNVMKTVSAVKADGFSSILPSNKTPNSLAVRFDSEEKIDGGIKKVKSLLRSKGYTLEDERVLKFDSKRDTTTVYKNGESVARLFYRVEDGSREGLAMEHVLAYALTGKITDQLKNRIDLLPDASPEQVKSQLNSEKFAPMLADAQKAALVIQKKIGRVVDAQSTGSTNAKADLVLKTEKGRTVGLSAKFGKDEENEYKMNKVLGLGDEDDSLVYNPAGVPWWIIGRKTFLALLKKNGKVSGKTYEPSPEDLEVPAWMTQAKESNPDIYKLTMETVYERIRQILTKSLQSLSLEELSEFAQEADFGKKEEREAYDMFLKVVSGPEGLRVLIVGQDDIDMNKIQKYDMTPEDMVVKEDSNIYIRIPGLPELKINSVKFKSDMLSPKLGDLKIKTR